MLQKVLLLSPFRPTVAQTMEQNCGKDDETCGKLYFDHAFPVFFFPDFELFDLRYLRLWVEYG